MIHIKALNRRAPVGDLHFIVDLEGFEPELLHPHGIVLLLGELFDDLRGQAGRDVNKAEMFSIPLEAASEIAPKIVSGSRVVFECRLTDMKEVTDHIFYIAEITACSGDDSVKHLFAWDGYARLDTADA